MHLNSEMPALLEKASTEGLLFYIEFGGDHYRMVSGSTRDRTWLTPAQMQEEYDYQIAKHGRCFGIWAPESPCVTAFELRHPRERLAEMRASLNEQSAAVAQFARDIGEA